jgi:CBS domain containing-hemolysin-like protein
VSLPVTIVAVGALLLLIVVLALCETVLAHTSRARVAMLGDEGANGARRLGELLARRQTNLAVIVVVRHAAQIGAVLLVLLHADRYSPEPLAWAAIVVGTVAVAAVVEGVAKTVALERTDDVGHRVATIGQLVTRLPLLPFLAERLGQRLRRRAPGSGDHHDHPPVSEEELLAFAEVARESEAIEEEEKALIESIIEFGDTIVREVMVPRLDMVTVESTWRVSDVMEVIILNGFSRIPVIGTSIDDVVGLAFAKDLMRAERDGIGDEPVAGHVRPARVVPEQQRVSVLLPQMQVEQFHMAVVVDEYGGVAGLVTLEDLIEELLGEIVDEFDVEEPMAEPLAGGAYQVNARMPLDEVNDLLGADLPEGDWDTIGGLLFSWLGHVPAKDESVDVGAHRLTATRVQGRRIGLVRIDRIDPAADAPSVDVVSEQAR